MKTKKQLKFLLLASFLFVAVFFTTEKASAGCGVCCPWGVCHPCGCTIPLIPAWVDPFTGTVIPNVFQCSANPFRQCDSADVPLADCKTSDASIHEAKAGWWIAGTANDVTLSSGSLFGRISMRTQAPDPAQPSMKSAETILTCSNGAWVNPPTVDTTNNNSFSDCYEKWVYNTGISGAADVEINKIDCDSEPKCGTPTDGSSSVAPSKGLCDGGNLSDTPVNRVNVYPDICDKYWSALGYGAKDDCTYNINEKICGAEADGAWASLGYPDLATCMTTIGRLVQGCTGFDGSNWEWFNEKGMANYNGLSDCDNDIKNNPVSIFVVGDGPIATPYWQWSCDSSGFAPAYCTLPVSVNKVDAPEFDQKSGTSFIGSGLVKISSKTVGAKIYYTMNGSDPTMSSSLYVSPIKITESKTIKAIAIKTGMNDSSIASASYVIDTSIPAIPVPGASGGQWREVTP